MTTYEIKPVPKPRQTQRDRWKKRPCVVRYRAFADECRAKIKSFSHCPRIVFVLEMPGSWSEKKKKELDGAPHQVRPDLSNLLKALEDALLEKDEMVWRANVSKVWGRAGLIKIGELGDAD